MPSKKKAARKIVEQSWDLLSFLHESALLESLRMWEFRPKFSPFDIYEKIVPADPLDSRWYPYESQLTKKLHDELTKSKFGRTIIINSVEAFLKYSPEIADIQITDPEKITGFIRYKDDAYDQNGRSVHGTFNLPRNLEIKESQKIVHFTAETVRQVFTECVFDPIYRVAGGRIGPDGYIPLGSREEEFMNEGDFIKKYDLYISKFYAFLIRKGDVEYLVQKFDKVLIEPILLQDMIYRYYKRHEAQALQATN